MYEYDYSSEITLDFAATGDIALDSLLHETEAAIQESRDFILPDDMFVNAITECSNFYGIPFPAEVDISHDGTGFLDTFNQSFGDDSIHFDREQLMQLGISGQDAVTMTTAHEYAHRMFQSSTFEGMNGGSWQEELSCDFYAGVMAGAQQLDISSFADAIENMHGSETHPDGELRREFMEYGKQIAEDLYAQGIEPNFENALSYLQTHLGEMSEAINESQHDIFASDSTLKQPVEMTFKGFSDNYEDLNSLKHRKDEYEQEMRNYEHHMKNGNIEQAQLDLKHAENAKSWMEHYQNRIDRNK